MTNIENISNPLIQKKCFISQLPYNFFMKISQLKNMNIFSSKLFHRAPSLKDTRFSSGIHKTIQNINIFIYTENTEYLVFISVNII